MTDNRLTTKALQSIAGSFDDVGRNLAELGPDDRRRVCAVIVDAIGRHCPQAVADLAGCAVFTVTLGGGQ